MHICHGDFFKEILQEWISLFRKLGIGEFLVELVNTACSIHKFHFTSVKRMAERGDFHFHQGIFIAIFPSDRFFRIHTGAAQKAFVGRNIFEYDGAVVIRMNVFFHDFAN